MSDGALNKIFFKLNIIVKLAIKWHSKKKGIREREVLERERY